MLLITGCARSGTQYISKVLKLLGKAVCHERVGCDGSSSFLFAPEDITQAPGYYEGLEFDVVLHQVREPLACISSCTTANKGSWSYINKFIDVLGLSLPQRCMKFWLSWNNLVEKKATWRYRIEDMESVWQEWCSYVGITAEYETIAHIPKNVHTRNHLSYTWDELMDADEDLCRQVIELGRTYGYGVDYEA